LQAELGPDTELRIQPRLQMFWIKLAAGDRHYWAGFQMPPRPPKMYRQGRSSGASSSPSCCSPARMPLPVTWQDRSASSMTRFASVGRGVSPPPLPENGPSEIVNLNRGFNEMLSNLRQIEEDRALLLAGVRTICARRSRGCVSGSRSERTTKRRGKAWSTTSRRWTGSSSQFLDFARDGREAPLEMQDPSDIVATVVERHQRAGRDVRFVRGEPARFAAARDRVPAPGTTSSTTRCAMVPAGEVTTRYANGSMVPKSPIAARHSGDQVERLKRPLPAATGHEAARQAQGSARDRGSYCPPPRRNAGPAAARGRRHDRARDASGVRRGVNPLGSQLSRIRRCSHSPLRSEADRADRSGTARTCLMPIDVFSGFRCGLAARRHKLRARNRRPICSNSLCDSSPFSVTVF